MRWGDMRRSENVEDRTAGGGGGGFGIGGLPLSGGALILVVIASLLFGVNPLELLGVMGGSGPAPEQRSAPDPRQGAAPGGGANQKLDERGEFAARVLSKRLAQHGIAHRYEEFDDTHSSIDYRMDASLPFLVRALKP